MSRLVRAFPILLVLAAAQPALAQGAWPVTHKWSDAARPNDPTSGSYAYEYAASALATAEKAVATGEKNDCSKFALSVLARYAQANGLEVHFTHPDPKNPSTNINTSSTDAQFKTPADFQAFYQNWINAKMIATLNTFPITYDEWRAGDVVMMRWNQLGDANPFPGRDVWHTFFVGDPDKLLFYGNIDGEESAHPTLLPITATASSSDLSDIHGAAVYQGSPRRWNMLEGAIVAPATPLTGVPHPLAPETGSVTASRLNLRAAPSAQGGIVGVATKGQTLSVEGVAPGNWVRVRLADGSVAYAMGTYLSIKTGNPAFPVDGFDPTPPAPPATPGITGALGNP
jgi:hypothetical protein